MPVEYTTEFAGPIAKKPVVPAAVWYGVDPAVPPSKLVARVTGVEPSSAVNWAAVAGVAGEAPLPNKKPVSDAAPVPPLAGDTIPVREIAGLLPPLEVSGATAVTAATLPGPAAVV